ncbi:MAG: PepSY-associated TM helix domain-containing protein [Bacteroidota bacterium]
MAKDRRNYNVFFNTHTVSGIVISVGLFVCFFAGAFALFLDEINHWEANAKREAYIIDINYERLLTIAEEEGYEMEGRDIFMRYREGAESYLQISGQALKPVMADSTKEDSTEEASQDEEKPQEIAEKDSQEAHSEDVAEVSLEEIAEESVLETSEEEIVELDPEAAALAKQDSIAKASFFLKVDPETYAVTAKEFDRKTKELGTFLYHLHYFQQIPTIGIYLAGLVALFFAFAILTGIIVHWNKIVSNFFTFRLKGSVKNLWTDAHTALGVIGLPFQFMYAVTGAFFGLIIFLYVPFLFILFDGDQDKLFELFRPKAEAGEIALLEDAGEVSLNALAWGTTAEFQPEDIEYITVQVQDYKTDEAQMTITTQLDGKKNFVAMTNTTFRLSDGAEIAHKPLDENTYAEVAPLTISRLHFAQFGGYLLKAVYFVLALVTCFVIMSGVMIWLTARDKKMYAHKAKFNKNVGAIYMGSSMGLFPAVALFFCMVKLFPLEMENRYDIMPALFFSFWLAFTVYAFFIKSTYKINKHALLLAGALGLLIPVFNGLQSGLWFWIAAQEGYLDSLFIDVAWIVMGVTSILSALYAKPVVDVKKARKPVQKKPVEAVDREGVPQLITD